MKYFRLLAMPPTRQSRYGDGARFISLLVAFCFFLLFLCSTLHAADITLAWDANTEADLAGYRLYQAEKTDNVTTAFEPIADIPAGTTTHTVTIDGRKNYVWQITAFDAEGNESRGSNMAEKVRPTDRIPPGQAKNLRRH